MSRPNARALSDYEVRARGWEALAERLGVSGAIRFLMQYEPGHGDYTRERKDLFADLTLDEALRRIDAVSGCSPGGDAPPAAGATGR